MKKKEIINKFSSMLVAQADLCNEDSVEIHQKITNLGEELAFLFNSLKEIVEKEDKHQRDSIWNLKQNDYKLNEDLKALKEHLGPDQAEFNRYKTAVAKMFERKAQELRGLFDKHDRSMIAKLNAFNGMQDQFTGFEKFITDKFNQLAAQLVQNTESLAAVQEEFTDFVSGEELQEQISELKDELHSVRELWHYRPSWAILEQENKSLKEQLSNLSENFDCLNNTVNEIMKREAIRDRGVQIPCPSTDEYDALMESEAPKQSRPSVEIVVATDCNGVIGVDGKIPWNCPEDLKLFKELTEGHVVVMGRKTYESLPEKFHKNGLPNRTNYVMSKNGQYTCNKNHETGMFNRSIMFTVLEPEEIINEECEAEKIFIIGGEEIYKLWMPYVDVIHHSRIATDINTELARTVAKFEFVDADWGCSVYENRKGFIYSKLIAMPGAKK